MDKLTPQERSENMRRIRSKGMKPELAVRRIVHRLGYRFRLHGKNLPGKPDLVFRPRHKVILVHGCFWHQHSHPSCKITRQPKSNTDYWTGKLKRTIARDLEHEKALISDGWEVLTIWECELANEQSTVKRLTKFLG
jgi:DNA mismatch endonuclease (patch repair protein)